MTIPDKTVIENTLDTLDRIERATDAQTEQALNASRRAALGSHNSKHNRHWMWALASAAVLVLVVGIYTAGRNGSEGAAITEQLVADAELYQDMEFYTWLAEELESDQ